MRIGVIGINHKLADLNLRELLAKAFQKRFARAKIVHPNQSFILLSTCNRTELYFSSDDLSSTHTYILTSLREEIAFEFEQKLYTFFQYDCFFHLAKVVSGLDSAIIGETEIQGQVKEAYLSALKLHSLEKDLHFLFQKCLKIGKEIRSKIPLEKGIPDLEHACLYKGKALFDSLEEAKVLFVGASDINVKIIRFLQAKGVSNIALANRTFETACQISHKLNLHPLPSWQNASSWGQYDWIIFGTKAPDYLITKENFSRDAKAKLIIDLSVPRNVDPEIASHKVHLMNIDEINSLLKDKRKGVLDFLKTAEKSIENLTRTQVSLFKKRDRSLASKALIEIKATSTTLG